MVKVIGVEPRTTREVVKVISSKDQDFEDLVRGDIVIVDISGNKESGRVVYVTNSQGRSTKEKKILRKANNDDLEKISQVEDEEKRVFNICLKKIKKHGLSMKLVGTSISLDGRNLIFYFTAEGRIDFRELLSDLVTTFKKMIRLQQIGPKDAAKLIGGFGLCGRQVCCQTFLSDMKSITMDLARDQNLEGVTSSKISGICGKLMCCLNYEAGMYSEARKGLPEVGKEVLIKGERGKVIALNVLSKKAIVELADGSKIEKSY